MIASRLFALFLFSFAVLQADDLSIKEATGVQAGIRLFDDWVKTEMSKAQIPGACIAIVYKNSIIWSKAYGSASLLPKRAMTLDTLFPVGSLTKPFTSCSIMKLWEEGKLDLDQPIDKYLQGFKIKDYDPQSLPITIRELLLNTSGLPQDAEIPYWNSLKFPSFQDLWQKMQEQSLVYQPGSHWKYSHLGYVLLGKIVELLSWQSYADYVQMHFFEPLGLSNSTFVVEQEKMNAVAQGFSRKIGTHSRAVIPFYNVNGLRPALGLYAPVEDIARFCSLFLSLEDPKHVLQSPTRRYMTRPMVTVNPQIAYGFGLSVRQQADMVLIEHPGSLPGFSSYMSLNARDSCAVVIMCNSQEWLIPWVNECGRWVFSAIGEAVKKPSTTVPTPLKWQKYIGKYSNQEYEVFVEIYKGKLVLYEPLFANMLDTLMPQGDDRFRIREGYTFGSTNGDPVQFQLTADGQVESLKIANIYLYPEKR